MTKELWIFVSDAICQNSMLLWKKISKDDLVLTYGVAFLEIDWSSGFKISCSIIKELATFWMKC
jgi:hypothetical protein